MENKNCPNCGAVYTLEDVKCPYCGTLYFDMTCIDFDKLEPIYVKFKVNNMIVTQCAIPKFETMEVTNDITDCVDHSGTLIKSVYVGRRLTTNIQFNAIQFPGTDDLFKIEYSG